MTPSAATSDPMLVDVTLALALLCGVLGLVIGSFLNVVAWRLPQGLSVAHPGSACPACGHAVRARDNVPVLSWLLLRGRCRDCGERISPRYLVVELVTGVLFAALALHLGPSPVLPAYLYLAAAGVVLTLIDLDHYRLPDAITLPSQVVGVVLLAVGTAFGGDWTAFRRGLVGMLVLWLVYEGLNRMPVPRRGRPVAVPVGAPGAEDEADLLVGHGTAAPADEVAPEEEDAPPVRRSGMGRGDVKLAPTLGLHLAYLGWGTFLTGAFGAFLLGSVIGVAQAAVLRSRAGESGSLLQSRIPFGPYMLVAALAAVLGAGALGDWYLSSLTGY
jgi:leader peptidase (prepilin peptidase)/N-methyltransferase